MPRPGRGPATGLRCTCGRPAAPCRIRVRQQDDGCRVRGAAPRSAGRPLTDSGLPRMRSLIPAMTHKRGGLLAQIEADVVDNTVPLSSLLQKCIVLGGQAASEKM